MSRSNLAGSKRASRGSVLMIVLILMSLLAAIPIMMQLVTSNNRSSQGQLNSVAQANNMARAGLLDAINWFRRQATQPVSANNQGLSYSDAAFQPVFSTNTAQSDTMDANIGIMEQYQIDANGGLWGRYEVRKATAGVGYPADPNSVHDITNVRIPNGVAGAGSVWYIESTGYVYMNKNPALPYYQSPNQVLGTAKIVTEIRRVTLAPPVNAAVIVNGGGGTNVTLSNNGRVIGGSNAGIAYYGANGSLSVSGGGLYSGTPSTQWISTGTLNAATVFGMSGHDLSLLADYSVTSVSQLPTSYPAQAIVYVSGNAAFSGTNALVGGGILYVTGTLTIPSSASAFFSGAMYSGGNVSVSGPASISGILLTAGTLTATGAGDAADIAYSNTIMNLTQQQVAQYRESRSEYYTFTAYK